MLSTFRDAGRELDDEWDIETTISQAQGLIQSLGNTWKPMDLPLKHRLQKAVLQGRITYQRSTAAFKTANISPILRLNQTFLTNSSELVAEVGRNLNHFVEDLKNIAQIAKDLRV